MGTASEGMVQDHDVDFKELYVAARRSFVAGVAFSDTVSRGCGQLPSATGQHYWASVLFTRIVVTSKSVQLLAPEIRPSAHWDFSALASLVRNVAECYLYFFFLCVDDVPEVEREARIIMLDLHDDGSRSRLFAEIGEQDPEPEKTAQRKVVRESLEARFRANAWLMALPEKRQRELLRGDKTPFVQDDVIDRTDLDRKQFRFIYRFLSAHTHSGPLAFYRMAEHGRGMGFSNPNDAMYAAWALEFGAGIIERATGAMLEMFPGAEQRGRKLRSAEIRRSPGSRR
ncbi:hypothetical protein FSB78_15145 [Sphingomonas ginsenosidivorax]|uniref:Uncharacterized protein n=1 Tax=Sphingomonas ginsenosidivorax TaxID=862135 RepID=A0A5C6UIT6_9SPHN|nr:DUF5677 domain-containing protein [Sphingomonas ginsenosidivorax]TXC72131.1 hypothetical protein FSB78_15145 [Sphingomonas ginsenosidivorax]